MARISGFVVISLLITLCAHTLVGCATPKVSQKERNNKEVVGPSPVVTGDESVAPRQSVRKKEKNPDPFEKFNRAMFKFNTKVDRYFAKPLAKGYRAVTPRPVRKGISNFFSNLREPIVILNDVLQGKVKQAGSDLGRFLMNSTLGLFGFIDVASKAGLKKHDEDFGQTLGKWGIKDGPYLVLPFFGPSSMRDAFGLVADAQVDPVRQKDDKSTRSKLTTLRVINTRANLLDATDILEQAGGQDPYLFVREFYRQRRRSLVHDGSPPDEDEEDPLLFEDEEGPADTPPADVTPESTIDGGSHPITRFSFPDP